MSSILKALKKLESQATDQNHDRVWRPKNHMRNDDHEQINGHLHLKKSHVIMFAALVLATGAGLILSNKLYEKKPKLITKKETLLEKPVPLAEKKAILPDKKAIAKIPSPLPQKMTAVPERKAEAIPQESVRLPEKRTAMPNKRVIPQKPLRFPEKTAALPDHGQNKLSFRKDVKKFEPIGKVTKAPPAATRESRRNTAELVDKKTSPLRQARKKTNVEKPSEESAQDREAERFLSMPLKRSSQTKIEVQAIAWAKDPKNRLAVINGLILREGESIDNIIVMHIGKDAVVFREGEEGWKQMFGF